MKFPLLLAAGLLAAATPVFAAEPPAAPKGGDVFVDLANQKNDTGVGAAVAKKLPDHALAWDAAPEDRFEPGAKITTQAGLEAELVRMRAKYSPFMAELAPPLPVIRRRVELKDFRWKLVSTEMGTDAKGGVMPLAGVRPAGNPEWKEVSIPHYCGPINKAEAHYRKDLELGPELLSSESLWLHFDAVDYIAEVYINGQKVGAHEGLFGAFEFDIKPFAKPGKNELEVRVFNDAIMMGDSLFLGPNRKFGKKIAACGGPGWDEPGLAKGWHMCAPGFGIWQTCRLETRPKAFINDVFVRPLPSESKAEVYVEIPDSAKSSELRWSLYGQNFSAKIAEHAAPANLEEIPNAPGAPGFTRLKFTVPVPKDAFRLWSLEEPWLYQIQVELARDGATIDAAKRAFGMRTFTQSSTGPLKGRFHLNGKEIKLRGANMMGNLMQCVIRKSPDQLRDDILLAKIANMNFWRMTQQPCQPEVYDAFDKLGLLAQTDLPLFVNIRRDQAAECRRQVGEMIRLVRGHPCDALVSYLNEPGHRAASLSNAEVAAAFKQWDADVETLNPGQVVKWLDGDYQNISRTYSDHHDYGIWYGDTIRSHYFDSWRTAPTASGWMRGMGEFGAEGLDSVACMERHYPAEWRTPAPDGDWSPAGIPRCQSISVGGKWFAPTPRTMNEWVDRTREHQMWGVRLMTESLRRAPVVNSFAVHLLIDAWPAGWLKSLVDCDRQAKPAYFAYRDALTPLAVNLRPDAFFGYTGDTLKVRAWVLNDTPEVPAGATLRYRTELDGKVVSTGRAPADIVASAPQHQGVLEIKLPAVASRRPLTVRLGLFSKEGALLHDTSVDIDLIPAAYKKKNIPNKGGQPQRLIR
jgi:hypothetical protein